MPETSPKRRNWGLVGALVATGAVGVLIGSALSGRPDGVGAAGGPPGAERGGAPSAGGGPPSARAGDPRGGGDPRGQRPPAVAMVAVKAEPIDQTLNAIGTGRALQSLTLTTDVSGVIEEILIKSGDLVEAGSALVRLNKEEQEIALARARADYNIARTNAARFKGLAADEAASALEDESARNELTATTAALRQAEYDLERRTIAAPFAGIVGLSNLDVGDFVPTGATITTIDDVSALLVDFVVPESASAFVKEGLDVAMIAQASGGREVVGKVRAIDSRVDPLSRTRRVEAVLVNDDRALIPGSTFSIALNAPGRTALAVPGLAVQWDRAGAFVWRAAADGSAERVPVVILRRTASSVLVEAGLADGDMIVAEGADLVRAGAPLRAGPARPASGEARASSGTQ